MADMAGAIRRWYLDFETGTSTGMQFEILPILNMLRKYEGLREGKRAGDPAVYGNCGDLKCAEKLGQGTVHRYARPTPSRSV